MKLLIIDDEGFAINKILYNFSNENWTINSAFSYDEAYNILKIKKYDIIICDYNFGNDCDKNGLKLIKEVRKDGISTPVILLTGKGFDEITPWDALDAGFDDFLKKPFEPKELKSRILAILRRKILKGNNLSNSLRFKNLEINFLKRKVVLNGRNIKLGNTIFLIIFKLIQNKGKIVTYEDMIEYIWGESSLYIIQYNSTLRVHITHLKKILGEDISKNIKTIHGVGYILDSYD